MPIVITNGKFSLLHHGHFNLLNYCRIRAGEDGEVVVAIDSDDRIGNPIFNQEQRKEALLALRFGTRNMVDKVIIFDSDRMLEYIISTGDVLVKGSDWKDRPIIGRCSTEVELFGTDDPKTSSSDIVKTILEKRKL